ncbi:UNVERIFIED_CONTAM: hypothetical protein NCL1_24363 [Trichonephila clavipes]
MNEANSPTSSEMKNIMKSMRISRVQRRVRTEWNVDPPTSKSILQWERTLKETGTLVSQTCKNPLVFVIEDTVDRMLDSFFSSMDVSSASQWRHSILFEQVVVHA